MLINYEYSADTDRIAVFSEVFYDGGWKAWLDGDRSKKVEVFAADWILRGAVLPKGNHTLTMSFEPSSYRTGKAVSLASSLLLLLTIIGLIPVTIKKKIGEVESTKCDGKSLSSGKGI